MIEIKYKKPKQILTGRRRFRADPRDFYLGKHRWKNFDIHIPYEGFYKNLWLLGPPGSGKSKLIEAMIPHSARFGPVISIDDHGDTNENVYHKLSRVPTMAKRVIYFDASNLETILKFNPIHLKHQLVTEKSSSLVDAISVFMGQSIEQTPRVNRILTATFTSLLLAKLTLNESQYLVSMVDNPIRRKILEQISDEYTRDQFNFLMALRPTERINQIESSMNRLINLTHNELLSLIFGSTKDTLDFEDLNDSKKILLLNLRKTGTLSPEQGYVFATFVLHEQIACVRARRPEKRPRDVCIYCDEAHNYINRMLADSFTADRKHGQRWIISHQIPSQLRDLDPYIYNSAQGGLQSRLVFGNLPWNEIEEIERDFFAGMHDLKKIKDKLYQRKILDYLEQTRIIRSWADADTEVSSWFSAEGETEVDSVAQNRGQVRSSGVTSADVMNPNAGWFQDPTLTHTDSVQETISDHFSEIEGHAKGNSHVEGEGGASGSTHTEGAAEVPFLKPVFGRELSKREFETIDEQRYKHCVSLKRMPERTCCLKILASPPLYVRIKNISTYRPRPARLERFTELMHNSHNCFAKAPEIRQEIEERRQALLEAAEEDDGYFED